MYKWMERVLKGVTRAEFTQQANSVDNYTFSDFTIFMAMMTMYFCSKQAYKD